MITAVTATAVIAVQNHHFSKMGASDARCCCAPDAGGEMSSSAAVPGTPVTGTIRFAADAAAAVGCVASSGVGRGDEGVCAGAWPAACSGVVPGGSLLRGGFASATVDINKRSVAKRLVEVAPKPFRVMRSVGVLLPMLAIANIVRAYATTVKNRP